MRAMSMFVLHSICFFFSLFFFSIVYSTTTGGAGRGRTGPTRAAIETRDETRGSTGECHVNVCFPFYLFLLLTLLLFQCLQYNNRRGRTGPTRAAIETRDETVGQQVRVMSCYLFSTLFILSSSHSSSFPLSTVQQQVGLDGAQRTGAGGTATRDGTRRQTSGKRR